MPVTGFRGLWGVGEQEKGWQTVRARRRRRGGLLACLFPCRGSCGAASQSRSSFSRSQDKIRFSLLFCSFLHQRFFATLHNFPFAPLLSRRGFPGTVNLLVVVPPSPFTAEFIPSTFAAARAPTSTVRNCLRCESPLNGFSQNPKSLGYIAFTTTTSTKSGFRSFETVAASWSRPRIR